MNGPMIHIGATPESIAAARDVILTIVNSPAADKVKVTALKTLDKLCAVGTTTISGCSLTGDTTHEHHHHHYPEAEDEQLDNDDQSEER